MKYLPVLVNNNVKVETTIIRSKSVKFYLIIEKSLNILLFYLLTQ
jgi:hypothetical protein